MSELRSELASAIRSAHKSEELHELALDLLELIIERESHAAEHHGYGRGMIASIEALEKATGGSDSLTEFKNQILSDTHERD